MYRQARARAHVPIELWATVVLPNREIRPAVMVEIAKRSPAGFTVNGNSPRLSPAPDSACLQVPHSPEQLK
jgi:hypothetical protein